ncbi:MAG TPA: hypothetical protein VHL34_02110 [Rhizomicrobium sp.]|jgi:hypothetical protein|nr:hypothetical protein [Rhizomicrobium sp.]
MRPEISELLRTTGMQLPGLAAPTGYAQASAGLITGMLMISAAHYDRAAEIRVMDNGEMRALFGTLAGGVKDAGLRASLEAAATSRDESIRVSALNAANAELRKLLIALQTHLEDAGDVDGQKQVWAVLQASAERRMLSVAMG